jgi:hypothetical protein
MELRSAGSGQVSFDVVEKVDVLWVCAGHHVFD